MVFRKRPNPPPPPPSPPPPWWRERVDAARALVRGHVRNDSIERRIDEIEEALLEADCDQQRASTALASLNPDVVAAELKTALRNQGPSDDDSPQVVALRARYETIHQLHDVVDSLVERTHTTFADLDAFAARAVSTSFGAGGAAPASAALNSAFADLHADLDALAEAHRIVDRHDR